MEFSETEGRHLFRWHGLSALPLTPMSKTKKKWPWAGGAVAVVAVAGAAGTGVVAQRELGELNHAPAYSMELPEPLPVEPAAGEPVDEAKLKEELGAQAANPQFGKLHVRVSNGTTGQRSSSRRLAIRCSRPVRRRCSPRRRRCTRSSRTRR